MGRVEVGVLIAAMALHGGGLAIARAIPELTPARAAFTEVMMLEVEVAPEPVRRAVVAEQQPDQTQPENTQAIAMNTEQPTSKGHRSSSGAASSEPGSGGTDENSSSEGVVTGPGTPGEEDWTGPPGGPGTGPGGPPGISPLAAAIALNNAAAPAAPTEAPKAKKADRDSANRVIKDELRKKDKALGLDLPAAGTIASMIKAQMQGSDAPGDAKASFQVVLGPSGNVQAVKVLSFAGGAASTYEGIARNVKAALSARKLNLTEDYKKGAIVVVNAQSKMQMPSGAEVGAGLKFSLKQEFDVADIGASPVRVVKVNFSAKPVE
ncbi:MAG: hypothetical protein HOW73_33500 [Polyangiaceae bacterium]|nr:hypothetical protein [Polyangiaceae bacterium]